MQHMVPAGLQSMCFDLYLFSTLILPHYTKIVRAHLTEQQAYPTSTWNFEASSLFMVHCFHCEQFHTMLALHAKSSLHIAPCGSLGASQAKQRFLHCCSQFSAESHTKVVLNDIILARGPGAAVLSREAESQLTGPEAQAPSAINCTCLQAQSS